ncbi:ArsR/SmtB family transcription factor [Deinococcus misasensis]|uniref:ArsR/SmtB family transcription factor n=1 Tax=Deinococcus misasensis TaxID=392413 RepID=UPI00054EE75A|nr:metalloregulator ArsR/SmtB family transcription factor [Deinococcus misasensis]
MTVPLPTPKETQGETLEHMAQLFKALSDPMRLKILLHLRTLTGQDLVSCCAQPGQVCACDLEEVTGLTQPTVSHHMKVLTQAKLVRGEKKGKWMYYAIDPRGAESIQLFLPHITLT